MAKEHDRGEGAGIDLDPAKLVGFAAQPAPGGTMSRTHSKIGGEVPPVAPQTDLSRLHSKIGTETLETVTVE